MFKLVGILFILFMVSCGSSNAVVKRQDICKRDKTMVCSKENAPILEKMDSKALSAQIEIFGASYRNGSAVKYMKTDISELDQCISVYQYYNCKAYCESDTITKEDKRKKDQEIIEQCSGRMDKTKDDRKEEKKDIAKSAIGNRVLIDFVTGDVEVDKTLKRIIYLAFEEKATESTGKYVIIDDEIRQKAWDRIKKEHNWPQNDPRFLPELQKQLAATVMVEIHITKLGSKFLLSNKFILLEKAVVLKTKNLKYTPVPSYDFDDKIDGKLKSEEIYDNFLKLAGEFLTSLDN